MKEGQKSLFESPIDEIRVIIERHLFPIYAGMISSEFFSRERETGAANDYLRLKELLRIDRGFDSSALASVRDFEKTSPDSSRRIMRELECQVAINVLRGRYRLYDAVFSAAGLLLNASPLARADADSDDLRRFIENLERGHISFE
jgi:hypothetical protein